MTLFVTGDGNTPLSPEEQAALMPNLATKEELNEWERQNIVEASAWALDPKNIRRLDRLDEAYIRDLHHRMFDQTWRWAGMYRTTNKNLGIAHHQIRESLAALLGDVYYWIDHKTFVADEIAVRFHHRLYSSFPQWERASRAFDG
jgi:Fic-DOC domain mobile mystery protein B